MKKLVLSILCLILISCSLSQKSIVNGTDEQIKINIQKNFIQLNKRYDALLDDEIKESERQKLEEDYVFFIEDLEKAKVERNIFFEKYIENSKLKLNFLKDLK